MFPTEADVNRALTINRKLTTMDGERLSYAGRRQRSGIGEPVVGSRAR